MNKLIENQLKKCKVAKLGEYDILKHQYIIPKHIELNFEINHIYLICVDNSILNPSSSDILACNWNNNSHPNSEYLKIDVTKKMGQMIYVNSISFDFINKKDTNIMWSGWLPVEKIKIIEQLY